MTIYIDSDFKCYTSNTDGRRAIETDAFNGKCEEWIESYRYVPAGETWVRGDGVMFSGEMVSPWKDLTDAYAAQAAYLADQIAQYETALSAIESALEVSV